MRQAEVHKYGKEDICVYAGDGMFPKEDGKKDSFVVEICCPKEKNSEEKTLVLDIKQTMESLILSHLNQKIEEGKGES